jgi:ubiquitin-protein ligase
MDQIFERFLEENWRNAKDLADSSDILQLLPFGNPPNAVLAQFNAACYIKTPSGIEVRKGFVVGFRFPENYLSLALPWEVLHFMTPEVYHPNVRPPAICLGGAALKPGTELRELLFRVYELVTYQRRSNPADPLNAEASAWVRRNWPVQPADTRPLKWRASPQKEAVVNDAT